MEITRGNFYDIAFSVVSLKIVSPTGLGLG